MHMLLASAALHLAVEGPVEEQERSRTDAARHRDVALSIVQPVLSDMREEYAHSLFAFTGMLGIFSLAFPRFDYDGPTPYSEVLDQLVEAVTIVRGVPIVMASNWPLMSQGPFKALLRSGFMDAQVPDAPLHIECALNRIDQTIGSQRIGLGERPALEKTLENLRHCFRLTNLSRHDAGIAIAWSAMCTPEFLLSLRERSPIALIVFAHFAILLHGIDWTWWARGRGRHLACAVKETLPVEWQHLARFPLNMIDCSEKMWDPDFYSARYPDDCVGTAVATSADGATTRPTS
jgi:hypothetical protein